MTYTYYQFKEHVTKFDFDSHSDFLRALQLIEDKIRVFGTEDNYYSIHDETSFVVPNDIVENITAEIANDNSLIGKFDTKEVTEYRVYS